MALAGTLLLVAMVGLLTWFQFTSAQEARRQVRHSHEVITGIDQLGIALRDAETGQRGFLLTGEEDDLALYRAALGRITLLQGELHRLTADNATRQERLRSLALVIQKKLETLGETIHLRREAGAAAAPAVLRADHDAQLMDQIRLSLETMQAEEERLLAQRQATAAGAEMQARQLALGGSVLAIGLLVLSARLLAQAQARLTASEAGQRALAEQMRAAFDSISQGIGVFGPDHRLLRWNERFPVLLALPRPTLQPGSPYEAIVAQAAAAGGGDAFLETADQIRHGRLLKLPGEPVVYERTRALDGRSFELRRTAMPDGGFVLTVTDTTERVRAELTARDAQRLQAMGQLTGGIAHDFNNLLTVVLGNLEMARPRLEEGHPVLPRIERAIWGARRGASLTQQLLAFARKQPLSPMPIDLSAMLPDLANLLHRTLGEHIDLQVVDAAGLWPAMADTAQLESAILNLALNARDAMPGGGRLTIALANKVLDADHARRHTEVTPGEYVMVAVSDTGTGMAPEVLARVFEPFFTTKEAGKGTGLGLPMVYGFVRQSGGHVTITSQPGEGTTVRLYLPRAPGAVLPAPQRGAACLTLPRGSGTILVVEDDAAVREVAVIILRELGYRVLEAGDGTEALRVFGQVGTRLDLVLVDVVLPGGMKGHEVARRLAEVRPELRTLFMSGYTENAIMHHGRLDEGVHLIGKPFSRELLARKVAELLSQEASDQAITALREPEHGKVVDLALRDRGRNA
ncbi:response regulator [Rhodovastum atsumiense]|uniref:histidine kinase n=2 Tax=Rhodovastum atsumiense TaxID=504468 RepID=A0A5M6IT72_9PROT|nr:response regulator [Rhodovastum atsumiense]